MTSFCPFSDRGVGGGRGRSLWARETSVADECRKPSIAVVPRLVKLQVKAVGRDLRQDDCYPNQIALLKTRLQIEVGLVKKEDTLLAQVWRWWGGAARRALRQRTLQSDCSHKKTRPFGQIESSCGWCGLVESPQPPERGVVWWLLVCLSLLSLKVSPAKPTPRTLPNRSVGSDP